ncbi:hypothetical protein CEXT_498631 [Caerostris extrusa]|uniref:Uncharacterized protein n=1 Tax=Caerostris extrusa TaxID=172846 RepID=A0AAV4TJG6_CAEEX|nr:hypothetical protein CEXT_498631 [Caerostris extrusa]
MRFAIVESVTVSGGRQTKGRRAAGKLPEHPSRHSPSPSHWKRASSRNTRESTMNGVPSKSPLISLCVDFAD